MAGGRVRGVKVAGGGVVRGRVVNVGGIVGSGVGFWGVLLMPAGGVKLKLVDRCCAGSGLLGSEGPEAAECPPVRDRASPGMLMPVLMPTPDSRMRSRIVLRTFSGSALSAAFESPLFAAARSEAAASGVARKRVDSRVVVVAV